MEDESLVQLIVDAFKKRFTASDTPSQNSLNSYTKVIQPCISLEDNERLLTNVSDLEVHNAVRSIGALKAPGSDGVHAIFYQNCWDNTKDHLKNLVDDFFNHNMSLKEINHTNIALIPKVNGPEIVSQFRPISLCNVAYKIITKIIINRLKPILSKCISKNQGAFALGRSISDNILIAHELFNDFKRRKGSRGTMAVKLGLEKAYDVLDWSYIKACLLQFGFSIGWCDIIMNCITSSSFSVLVNGSPSDFITPSRGIRQGDPLSPYIFILCMKPFIRHCNALASASKTNVGILSSPRGFRISNLVFADDCLIFAKVTLVAARNINKLLISFSKVSGQKINFHKSTVYFSNNVSASSRSNLSNIMQI